MVTYFFFLDRPALDMAIAILCFRGRPSFRRVLILLDIAFLLLPFWSGTLLTSVRPGRLILHRTFHLHRKHQMGFLHNYLHCWVYYCIFHDISYLFVPGSGTAYQPSGRWAGLSDSIQDLPSQVYTLPTTSGPIRTGSPGEGNTTIRDTQPDRNIRVRATAVRPLFFANFFLSTPYSTISSFQLGQTFYFLHQD